MELPHPNSLSMLRDSLSEAQATVRAYDTKAQIVGVGYIFALGIVGSIEDSIPKTSDGALLGIVIAWGIVIMPIFLFGYVLHPSRKKVPKLANEQSAQLEHILYINPKNYSSIKDLRASADRCDPIDEIAFELLKVSKLRELKRQRFLRALLAAGFCFVVIFTSELARVL